MTGKDGQTFEDVTHHTAGGHALGCDVACAVEPGLVSFGPALVRVAGAEYVLARHEYALTAVDVDRIATVGLVLVDGVARLQVIEAEVSDTGEEHEIDQAFAIVATLWIPAGGTSPDRVHRYVVTPASPLPDSESSSRTMAPLRPDLSPANRTRAAAARARRQVELDLEARRDAPLRADTLTPDEIEALVVVLARSQGLVT